MRRFGSILLSFALSAVLIVICFRGTDPAAVVRSLSRAHPGYVALAVLVGLLSFAGRALRWRSLLTHLKRDIPFGSLLSCTIIGFMLSYVLFKVGELARPVLLARREKMSKGSVIATVAVARMMDFLAVLLLFSIYLIGFSSRLPEGGSESWMLQFRGRGILVGGAILLAVLALYATVLARNRLFRILESWTRPASLWRKLVDFLHSMVRGFEVLKSWRALVVGMLYTLATWGLIDLSILAGLKAFEIPMDFVDVFLLIAFLAVGIAAPTPAGLGSYQATGLFCLVTFFGLPREEALAAVWTQWCVAVIPVVLLGAALIWKEGLSMGQLGRMLQSERETSS
ncbi:MAG TPA: lysylphosphatidylglycerol synthase transmembrane domain-containing protein [Candidatus Polarisedimenticolia bacterium]|nr:lysylphosphatidylglycerol synthase transmembrane domain-containing protein [Candidatus Polarisedimenticolia bacterium]